MAVQVSSWRQCLRRGLALLGTWGVVMGLGAAPASVLAQPGQVWRTCANEGDTCQISGQAEVRYGANGRYSSRTVSGAVRCNNDTFGDPAPNVPKRCEVLEQAWVFCSREGGTCNTPGRTQVRYGADGRYATREVSGAVACNNDSFGDPAPNKPKQCQYMPRAGGAQAGTDGGTWRMCATENQWCKFRGTARVRYGANGQYAYREGTDGLNCSSDIFGKDPAYGKVKQCEVLR